MSNVRIVPEPRKSLLDHLVDGIDQDPAFQRVVGAPQGGNGGSAGDSEGTQPQGRGVILHTTRLQQFPGLGKRMRDVEEYFGLVQDNNSRRVVRESPGAHPRTETNALFAILQKASGNDEIARAYFRGVEECAKVDETMGCCVVTNANNVVNTLGTASMCLAYAVFGDRLRAEKFYAGLSSLCVWGSLKAGGRVVNTGAGGVRPAENGLAALAVDAVDKNYQDVLHGIQNYFSFERNKDGKVSVWRRLPGESTFFGAEDLLALSLCFRVLGGGDADGVLAKAAQDLSQERTIGDEVIVFDGGGQTNAFLNVMYLLNKMARGEK